MTSLTVDLGADTTLSLTAVRGPTPRLEDRPGGGTLVVLEESAEYRYSLARRSGRVSTPTLDRSRLFSPDPGACSGRLRTRLRVGRVTVMVSWDDGCLAELALEVRTRKLVWASDYRAMLGDIANTAAELAMRYFAATELRARQAHSVEPHTLYARVAFLEDMLDGPLGAALRHIRHAPYVTWEPRREQVDPSAGVRASSAVLHALVAPGPRRPLARPREGWPARLRSLPRQIEVTRPEATHDNAPNRFVRFALEEWSGLVDDVRAAIVALRAGSSRTTDDESWVRGEAVCARLARALEGERRAGWLAQVGRTRRFPGANTVLQRRTGYRTVLRTWLAGELAAQLEWDGGADVYSAGQRDVAALYEMWVYLQIAQIVSRLVRDETPGEEFWARLFDRQDHGLALTLRRRQSALLRGSTVRRGRRLHVKLYFNETFRPTQRAAGGHGSWTLEMRPDCSLHVTTDRANRESGLWLHFDAKYRLVGWRRLGGEDGDDDFTDLDDDGDAPSTPASPARGRGGPKRPDLLKMHAYRDAIRRSAGAYVVFPGDSDADRFPEYAEVLPGLGAFALRPGPDCAEGVGALASFLESALDHVANQASQRERAWWWRGRAFAGELREVAAAPFLRRPPADTWVLLGYVHDAAHLAWVLERGVYNLRADRERAGSVGLGSRELATDLVWLYSGVPGVAPVLVRCSGEVELLTADELVGRGYPRRPGGERYVGLGVEAVEVGEEWSLAWAEVESVAVAAAVRGEGVDGVLGAPVVVSWGRFVEVVGGAVER